MTDKPKHRVVLDNGTTIEGEPCGDVSRGAGFGLCADEPSAGETKDIPCGPLPGDSPLAVGIGLPEGASATYGGIPMPDGCLILKPESAE